MVQRQARPVQRKAGPVQHERILAILIPALTITIIMSLLWYARLQLYTLLSYTMGTLGILAGMSLFYVYLNYLVDNEEQQDHRPAGPVQHERNIGILIPASTITIIMSLIWYARLQLSHF